MPALAAGHTKQRASPATAQRLIHATTVAAWAVTVAWAVQMGMGLWGMPGTMGLSLPTFIVMWAVMMTAMMFSSIGPLATLYARTLDSQYRLLGLGAGYLLAWTATGLAAYTIAVVFGELAAARPGIAQAVAVGCFALAGLYQLTPLKHRCLSHCRSPIGHLVHIVSFQGSLRDVRAGLHHGVFCLGCCWGLMVLMVAFGVMNIAAMALLAAVIAAEKQWRHGERLAQVVGAACLLWAVVVAVEPAAAPGLDPGALVMDMGTDMGMDPAEMMDPGAG